MTGDDSPTVNVSLARQPTGAGPIRMSLTLPDGYETSVYAWQPNQAARRQPVVYLHGIQSHPGWFVASAEALANAGYPVFQVTRRGSGDNQRHRGHARSAGQLLADVGAACQFAGRQTQQRRCHLLGCSWGGKLAAAYLAKRSQSAAVASLGLIAPGIVAQVDVSMWVKLGVALCSAIWPRKRFAIPLSEPELFTDCETMRAYLRSDPCRLRRATARFLLASRQLDWALSRAKAGCIQHPTTLLLARRERIIDNEPTRQAIGRLTDGRAIIETFDACHTLDLEPDPSAFLRALVASVDRAEALGD